MIISCPSCNTKFNIDENKIKGKSVKLKCSRCGHMFAPLMEPVQEEKPDEALQKPQELSPGETQESTGTSAEEGQQMDDELKSAIDEALKEFKLAESKTAETPSDFDFGETVKPENEIVGDINFSVREEPKKEEEFVSSGFELKTEDILGTSKSDTPEMEGFQSTKISSEPDLIGDLELELGGKKTEARTDEVLPEVKEDDFGLETPQKTVTPPPAPAFSKTPTPGPVRPTPVQVRAPAIPERAPSRGVLPYIFFFFIVAASGILGYQYRNELSSLIPGRNQEVVQQKAFTVVQSKYNFMQNIRGQTLFIVEGKAKNASTKVQSFLKLKVTLKDTDGRGIAEKEFYAGNIVSDEALRTEPAPQVEERFNNRVGDALANMNIKPQDEVPFMVVFYDIPNVSSYSIEVISSEEFH